jgi:hypothetical protein
LPEDLNYGGISFCILKTALPEPGKAFAFLKSNDIEADGTAFPARGLARDI